MRKWSKLESGVFGLFVGVAGCLIIFLFARGVSSEAEDYEAPEFKTDVLGYHSYAMHGGDGVPVQLFQFRDGTALCVIGIDVAGAPPVVLARKTSSHLTWDPIYLPGGVPSNDE